MRLAAALALALAIPALGQSPTTAAPTLRDQPLAGTWATAAVTIPQAGGLAAREEVAGGRVHLRIPLALQGRIAILGRGDAITLPGAEGVEIGSVRAVEAYVGLEAVVLAHRGLDVAVAAVSGRTFPFSGTGPRVEALRITAGGAVVHHLRSGAWSALLVGRHEAAGPGARVLASVHVPLRAGFAVLGDYVSGEGGWFRPAVAWGVSW